MRAKHLFEIPGAPEGWFRNSILFPFLATRLAWVLIGNFAYGNYATNPSYEKYYERGYFLSKYFILDMFSRWDARWYLSIIQEGYHPSAELTKQYSNMAFFPLYPYLVKSLGWFGWDLPNAYYLLIGLLLSNLLFIGAMILLYRLVVVVLGFRPDAAQRTLGLVFAFPAGFFFSSFYPESLFLFLSVAAFLSASQENWRVTGILAALGILTRPQGVLLLAALAWIYMEKRSWRWREINLSAGWFVLAPLALLAHFYSLYLKSGRIFAILDANAAWGRLGLYSLADPLRNLRGPVLDVWKIDAFLLLVFLFCGIYILWKWPIKSLGIFSILMCFLPLYTGLLVSMSRLLSVIFPVFILLGVRLKDRSAFLMVTVPSFALQAVYFAGWVNYYWIA